MSDRFESLTELEFGISPSDWALQHSMCDAVCNPCLELLLSKRCG